MITKIVLAAISIIVPFVGLLSGLYYFGIFKKTVTARPVFAAILIVLAIPCTLLFVLSLTSSSTEVGISSEAEIASEPKPKATFDDNMSAAREIKVGMSDIEVFRMEATDKDGKLKTLGRRQIIDFEEVNNSSSFHIAIEVSDGQYLRLTPDLARPNSISPYYSLIIHPVITASSYPTMVVFEITNATNQDAEVISVTRVSCDTVEGLILRATHSLKQWPSASACARE